MGWREKLGLTKEERKRVKEKKKQPKFEKSNKD